MSTITYSRQYLGVDELPRLLQAGAERVYATTKSAPQIVTISHYYWVGATIRVVVHDAQGIALFVSPWSLYERKDI